MGRTSMFTSALSLEVILHFVLKNLVRASNFLVQKSERWGLFIRALHKTSCKQHPRSLRLLATSAHCMKLYLNPDYFDSVLPRVIYTEKCGTADVNVHIR